MGDNLNFDQDDLSQQENDIALEGKKILTPEQTKPGLELPNNTKRGSGKPASAKSPRSKTPGNQSLVLQMYSHLRLQRKLEEEKKSKIARSDRRRQKIKRELAESCSPSGSSLKSFGSSWTHFRILRGQQGQLQDKHSDMEDRHVSNSPETDSNQVLDAPDDECVSLEVDNAPGIIRFPSTDQGHVEHLNCEADDAVDSPDRLRRKTQEKQQQPEPSLTSPQHQMQTSHNRSIVNSEDSHHRSRAKVATPSINMSHVLKGPGKIQIRFSTCSTPGSRQANRGHKHNYQWDTMPAGSLTSVQPTLINLDGSIL
ncbi:hypothetical protein RRG08_028106 [Elysia crispata]|uniref:Uncharacterized protein n=1 Tax=Elysia crispata TaxID=231223 RepID=A0AAE1DT36_9GAST|nr:hypothetical protein RRG08_028106 [Elysia crispata]